MDGAVRRRCMWPTARQSTAGEPFQLRRPIRTGAVYRLAPSAVFAKALMIHDVAAAPGTTNATVTWTTVSNATTQVEYGFSTNYGQWSALDQTPTTNHTVILTDLIPGSNYFFRAVSTIGATELLGRVWLPGQRLDRGNYFRPGQHLEI